jgi:diguanylate cyclase (GGDEF)-like protein
VLSQRDGLTGIANRRWFEQVLRREWLDARRQAVPIAVLLLDVDHFKLYNDHYGHQAGDRVLRRIARSLASVLRSGERHLLARYGGEEFVVLLPGLTNDDAARLAENLRAAVGSLAIVHGAWGSDAIVTISAGLASMVPAPGLTAAALVAAADSMLYAAKQAGRNRLCVHPAGPGP